MKNAPKLALLALTTMLGVATAQQGGRVELVFRQFDPPNEISALNAAVAKWNAANPNVQVRVTSVAGGEALNTYIREVQARGGPDVVQLGFAWVPELQRSKLILPLDEFLKASPLPRPVTDFLATDVTVFDGALYAAPWTADTFAFTYRKDLFDKASLRTFPTTWPGLFDAAKKLTVDKNGDGRTDQYGLCLAAGAGVGSSVWFLSNYYLWSNGATYVRKDASGKWQVGATGAQLARAIDYFNSFFTSGAMPRSNIALTNYADPEITTGLGRGDCAIAFMPPQTFRTAQATSTEPLATGIIPAGTSGRISHLGGRALAINPNSKNPAQAWAFIKYLISAEVMNTLPQYPAQRTLLRSIKFPAAEQGFVDMLPRAATFKRYTDSPAPLVGLAEATTREYTAVFSGQKNSAQAAASMTTAINNLLGNR
jgi:multiple sugar transport system substrate-binding protein